MNPISSDFSWLVGLEFFNYSVNILDVDEYNDGRDEDEKFHPQKKCRDYGTDIKNGCYL